MAVTGDNVLISLIILAVMVTAIAVKSDTLLFRIGAMMAWFALGIMFMTGAFGVTWATSWVQLIGLSCLIMAFACLILQWRTESAKKKPYISKSVQYRMDLQERLGRKRKSRRYRL